MLRHILLILALVRQWDLKESKMTLNALFTCWKVLEKIIIDTINVIKTNKKNLKNKWCVTSCSCWGGGGGNREKLRDIHKENVMLLLLLLF